MQEDYLDLMDRFIAASKEKGGTPERVQQLLEARWDYKVPTHPELEKYGRYRRKDGHLIFLLQPIIENWNLTELQRTNIMSACCCDAKGRYKWPNPETGEMEYMASAFTGFDANGGKDFMTGGDIMVSGWPAERWELVKQPDDTIKPKPFGFFSEPTYRTRFATIEEAEAFVWRGT